jgi:hypothetical protein
VSASLIAVTLKLIKQIHGKNISLKKLPLLCWKKILQPEGNGTNERRNKSLPFASILSQFNPF